MKTSEAILIGMERFPRGVKYVFSNGRGAACVAGCYNYAMTGIAEKIAPYLINRFVAFHNEYAVTPYTLNDEGMPRDVIAGMFAAMGD